MMLMSKHCSSKTTVLAFTFSVTLMLLLTDLTSAPGDKSIGIPSLPSASQHPSYGDCLEVKREYYLNCSVLGCVTMFKVSSTLM